MKENVKKELDTYMMMIDNWRNCYVGWLEEPGDNTYIVDELKESIGTYIAPKMRRLMEEEYLTSDDATDFWHKLVKVIDDLAETVRKFDGGENE